MAGSLAEAFQAAAAAAVSAVGDLATSITYNQKSNATYNASTGVLTRTTVSETVSGIVESYSDKAMNNQTIAVGDRKVAIPGSSFSSISPEQGDEMVIGGETFVVVRAAIDAARALWTFQVRKQT